MSDTVLITPDELSTLAASGKIVIIDTRDPKSYAAGHIPGAVNLHEIFTYLATSTPDGMAELFGKFAKAFGDAGLSGAETAVVYEQSMNSGFGQSCRGYFLLQALGYKAAKVLHGGLAAWSSAGKPVTTVVPTPTSKSFPVDPSAAALVADKEAMKTAIASSKVAKLDVHASKGLLGLLGVAAGSMDLGDLQLSGSLDIVRAKDGRTNLEKALGLGASPQPGSASPSRAPTQPCCCSAPIS